MMILIAGPYRSCTNDDPALINNNVRAMTEIALDVYHLGHVPILGEWLALPLIEAAGSKELGDEIFSEIFHPVATSLIVFCDAILRIGGQSTGADEMVAQGKAKGKSIFYSLNEIPSAQI